MTDSGFDLGLDDPSRAGVFFVTTQDLDVLGAASRDAGLLSRHIDLMGCRNKATLLLRIAVALDFPMSAGRNWDALSDSLRDLQWLPGQGYVLLFDGAGEMHSVDEADFDTLVNVLDEASTAWAAREVPFWAFLALREKDFVELED
ncbi:MAG: barnase inhibitor [Lysobacteraceae bacterium]|jgi:RNAse (barnase) inhibitor barstar|nr:MAG: barnase inhibitor [Xanthomonadaceae bacterium]